MRMFLALCVTLFVGGIALPLSKHNPFAVQETQPAREGLDGMIAVFELRSLFDPATGEVILPNPSDPVFHFVCVRNGRPDGCGPLYAPPSPPDYDLETDQGTSLSTSPEARK